MRLINTSTYLLDEFFGDEIPGYAILSHTWSKEELSIREWTKPTPLTASKTGYVKVRKACTVAKNLGHEWLWADTVCIDKTSSAELSEAINSMYAWYRDSRLCLAYLADVDFNAEDRLFVASRWFTRGCTLQELIAPRHLLFFGRDWHELGTRHSHSKVIANATGISIYQLEGSGIRAPLGQTSIAHRMSWIAQRQTTRVEDMAYCMLGIFGINMPLLYGEGNKAFIRLQHEILRTYHDHSIFTWIQVGADHDRYDRTRLFPCDPTGVLALSPASFASLSDVKSHSYLFRIPWKRSPYSLNNLGLSIRLPAIRTTSGFIVFLEATTRLGARKHHDYPNQPFRFLSIVLHGEDIEGVLARAWSPVCPLQICSAVPVPPLTDLLLETRPNPPRLGLWGRVSSELLSKYALFVVFKDCLLAQQPDLSVHPQPCFDSLKILIVFPSSRVPAAWIAVDSTTASAHVSIETTAVALCLSWEDLETGHSGFTFLFTLSIVTVEEGDEPPRTHIQFGRGVPIPNDLHLCGLDSIASSISISGKNSPGNLNPDAPDDEMYDEWLRNDFWARAELEKEQQRIFHKYGEGESASANRGTPPLYLKFREELMVDVACCDIGCDGFEETRVLNIQLAGLYPGRRWR